MFFEIISEFARRLKPNSTANEKQISNVWELGGSNASAAHHLAGVPISKQIDSSVVVVVVDTSSPNNVVLSLTRWLKLMRNRVDEALANLEKVSPERARKLQEQTELSVPTSHPDYGLIKLFPVPLLIVANKFDVLKDEDSGGRKSLHQALRFIAHANGAHLVSGSNRDKTSRELFRSFARNRLFPDCHGINSQQTSEKEKASSPSKLHQRWSKAYSISDSDALSIRAGYDTFGAILEKPPKPFSQSDFLSHKGIGEEAIINLNSAVEGYFGKSTQNLKNNGKNGADKDHNNFETNDDDDEVGLLELHQCPAIDQARAGAVSSLALFKKEAIRLRSLI